MISQRVIAALSTIPKRDHLDLYEALAKVVEAAELITDEIAMSRSHNYQIESAGAKVFVALTALDETLKEIED